MLSYFILSYLIYRDVSFFTCYTDWLWCSVLLVCTVYPASISSEPKNEIFTAAILDYLSHLNLNLKKLYLTQDIKNSIHIVWIKEYFQRYIHGQNDKECQETLTKAQLYRWRKSQLWWLDDTRHRTQTLPLIIVVYMRRNLFMRRQRHLEQSSWLFI